MKIIFGIFRRETQTILETAKNILIKCQKKIEDRVTKKLSQEFSEPEGHILGALSRVEEILMIPHALADSGPVPETTRVLSE